MNAVVILLVAIAILVVGYLCYGRWLAKEWGVDPSKRTPAHEMEDGVDYVPASAPVLLGHHFSSIAGAGPINGPIQAAVFGWVPVLLWVLIGGIFFGAVHDFGALFASIRNKGQSIGEVIAVSIGSRARKLFLIFAYLTLILVVAAFASIVAGTFASPEPGANIANERTAMISILFIVIAIAFGFAVHRRNVGIVPSTIIGVIAIAICMAIGYNFHPLSLSSNTWMIIIAIYILIASVAPVWILLQPRDYLSSFLLYFMMIVAVIGIVGAHPTLEIPAFTGFNNEALGPMFPALFITIACGAISGFHSLVSSGTSSKQLNKEGDALPIGYGGMLIECALATISLCAIGFVWANRGDYATPTQVFAGGNSAMVAKIPGLAGLEDIAYSMLILAVSAFCLTSLDTATRLSRFMFQEFWLDGKDPSEVTGIRATLSNTYVATIISVVLGVGLGMTGYANIWPLFGAANQLLAALGLLAIAAWLGSLGKKNGMLFIPMLFMLAATIVSLCFTIKNNFTAAMGADGTAWHWIRAIIAILLVVLAVVLTIEGITTMKKKSAVSK